MEIIWVNMIQYIGQNVFNYGVGLAALVWAVKKIREKKVVVQNIVEQVSVPKPIKPVEGTKFVHD